MYKQDTSREQEKKMKNSTEDDAWSMRDEDDKKGNRDGENVVYSECECQTT